jgi:hypothetical protein
LRLLWSLFGSYALQLREVFSLHEHQPIKNLLALTLTLSASTTMMIQALHQPKIGEVKRDLARQILDRRNRPTDRPTTQPTNQ